ncbi:hypothetical protein [Pleionea sediminis]|uniref:hypothetical protein n=1 Tax=Pleionea sediminis TaxID=2569479 RepID=UPI0011858CE7|nr:hypothetical protein [Pleionea sediminis]
MNINYTISGFYKLPESTLLYCKVRLLDVISLRYIAQPSSRGERLVNASGVCLVEFNEDGSPHEVTHIGSDDQDIIFEIEEGEARWE